MAVCGVPRNVIAVHSRIRASIVAIALLTACATSRNYSDPAGPRYAGAPRAAATDADTLKIVAFNVAFARQVERAIVLINWSIALRNPDILLLQEMDERGVKAIADSLGFGYVYFPATLHPATGRDFGNAVLSRYPIEGDSKIVLPYLARWRKTLRAAVAATIRVGQRRVRVYSVHLSTFIGNGPNDRRAQLEAVLADADTFPIVVMGGDFNSETVPRLALARGYTWPTHNLGNTGSIWSLDHILLKGLAMAGPRTTGVVMDNGGISDHKPVWVRVVLPARDTAAAATSGSRL